MNSIKLIVPILLSILLNKQYMNTCTYLKPEKHHNVIWTANMSKCMVAWWYLVPNAFFIVFKPILSINITPTQHMNGIKLIVPILLSILLNKQYMNTCTYLKPEKHHNVIWTANMSKCMVAWWYLVPNAFFIVFKPIIMSINITPTQHMNSIKLILPILLTILLNKQYMNTCTYLKAEINLTRLHVTPSWFYLLNHTWKPSLWLVMYELSLLLY